MSWSSVYGSSGGSSTSGGGGWAGTYGGAGGAKKSSGDSGLWGDITGIGHTIASHSGVVGRLVHGAEETITGIPPALSALYAQSQYDAKHYPFFTNPLHWRGEIEQAWNDPHSAFGGFVHPAVNAYRQKYGAVFTHPTSGRAWEHVGGNVWKDPFGSVLDAATIASLGGTSALKLARTGALGENAAELARSERAITSTSGNFDVPLRSARTLQGKLRQRVFDNYSRTHPDMPIVGVERRIKRILDSRINTAMLRARVPVRKFQRVVRGLTPDQKFAFHVAVEGVPLDDRLAYYSQRLAEAPTKRLGEYVDALKHPGVRDALENPTPDFIDALHRGAGLEAKAGEHLVQTGQTTEETRAERAALPQRAVYGEDVAHVSGENLIHPGFPAPFRFRHVGDQNVAGAFVAPKTEGMLGKARPLSQLKHNAGVLFRDALYQTDPERVISADYLQTMRNRAILETQRGALDKIALNLDSELPHVGFKQPDEWYYRPSYNRKTTAPISRDVQRAQALHEELQPIRSDLTRAEAKKSAGGIVSQDLHELGVPERDLHDVEKLKLLGVKRVPAAYGKSFHEDFAGSSMAIRFLIDRPLDVWRAITLNYRPAWAVNNFVGNAVMGLATYGPAGAAAYLRVLLAHEKGEQKVMRLWRFTKTRPTLVRKYGRVFEDVAPELHSAGLFGTQTKVTNPGVYEGRLANIMQNPVTKTGLYIPKQAGRAVMGVGRGITRLEVWAAEDTGREAAFIRQAGGDIKRIRANAKAMGEANLSLAEALRRLEPEAVERAVRAVNDALGNFNDLSHVERAVIRRAVPFYSWFKVITKVSGKYLARYPARVKMIQLMEQARDTKGEPPLPSWLSGSILLGKPHNGTQTLISTQGLNPYETIPQITGGGPGSVLNPFALSAIIGATGRNPAFGNLQDYYGFGATNRGGWSGFAERAGGSFLSSLAPVRLATAETQPYHGKLYAPNTYGRNVLLQYLGLPLRDVKVQEAKRERGL